MLEALIGVGGVVMSALLYVAGVRRERRAQTRALLAHRQQSARQIVSCTEAVLRVLRVRLSNFRRATVDGAWRAFLQIESEELLPPGREHTLQNAIAATDAMTHGATHRWESVITECRQLDARHATLRSLAAVPGDDAMIATKLIGYEGSLERIAGSFCENLRAMHPYAAPDTQAAIDHVMEDR